MDEQVVVGEEEIQMHEEVVVGEQDVSRAGVVRRKINTLIKQTNSSTFDIAELLHEVKTKLFFTGWGFDSFSEFAKTLEIKYTKAFYLVKIVECMRAAAVEREKYEPVGLAKLRVISRLEPEDEYKGTPMVMLIHELTLKAPEMSLEEVQAEVEILLGLVAEDSMCWWNLRLKKLARENVCIPAVRKAKRFMGQTQQEDGVFKDASDGAAVEMIMANFLADANFDKPDDGTTEQAPSEPAADSTEIDEAAKQSAESIPDTTTIDTNDKYAIE